jgi:hypothetical protein
LVERDCVDRLAPPGAEQEGVETADDEERCRDDGELLDENANASELDDIVASGREDGGRVLGRFTPKKFDNVLQDQCDACGGQDPGVAAGLIAGPVEGPNRDALEPVPENSQNTHHHEQCDQRWSSRDQERYGQVRPDHQEVALAEV